MNVVMALLVACAGVAVSQGTFCTHDDQCQDAYFCDTLNSNSCRECLRCEDLKREPMTTPLDQACTKSVSDCGPCLAGLVEDRPSGNVNAPCVPEGSVPSWHTPVDPPTPPTYVWFIIAILLFLIIAGILVYMLRKRIDTLKILATMRASLVSPTQYRSSEPEGGRCAPPPYNSAAPEYTPVRPTSPPLEPPHYVPPVPSATYTDQESERPFIDRKELTGVSGSRQSDRNQEAMPYHHPRVRFPDQPPSYDSALNEEESNPELHEDETVASVWTPAAAGDNNHTNNTSNSSGAAVNPPGSEAELSTLLDEARNTTVIRPPPQDRRADVPDEATPTKVLCVRQEPNNNRVSMDAGEGSSMHPPSPHRPLDIKIFVQQHNDVRILNT